MPADREFARRTLMIQGCTSDAGKSAVVTGLARLLHRHGRSVAPFKPQNMANNSAVTVDGGEIGRAQALQARAAGLEPHTDMNPVLLKPGGEQHAQVVVQGRVVASMDARRYHGWKRTVRGAMLESYRRLAAAHEVVLAEGAGSPAEINLRDNDIANMGFAEAVDCPVWLVADIERGGVFAHLAGTLALLAPGERRRIRGFIINRFRGDPAILQPGLTWLERHTGVPVLAVLPYLHGLHLAAEDSMALRDRAAGHADEGTQQLRVAAPLLPRIANHTDLEPLALHPEVKLLWVRPGDPIPAADLVILPGSRSVCADLAHLREHGWEQALCKHLRYGGKLLGVCGGFQMLGRMVHDPGGIEGAPGSVPGLGLFNMETTLAPAKQLRHVRGRLLLNDAPLSGYEIHMGLSSGAALAHPAALLDGRPDGACSEDRQVLGTYVHGLFDNPAACAALLRWAGRATQAHDYEALLERGINTLADALEHHLQERALAWLLHGDNKRAQPCMIAHPAP